MRKLFNRLLAIILVALALELIRRARLVVNVVRGLESIVKGRRESGSTQPLHDN